MISKEELDYYRSRSISTLENDRLMAFTALRDSVQRGCCNLTSSDLNAIWDSTIDNSSRKWLQSLSSFHGSIFNLYSYNRMLVWRQFGFNLKNDSLSSKETRTYLYYVNAKYTFTGLSRERLLAYILDESTIMEMGLKNDMTQRLLKDYYSQPGFPEYKKWVKELENKAAAKIAKNEKRIKRPL